MSKGQLLVVNCKTYEKGTGRAAITLAKAALKVNPETILCVQATDISRVAKTGIVVFAQHVDPEEFGAHTGEVLAESIKKAGAEGTLINHSEHSLTFTQIKKTLEHCKKLKLKTIICAKNAAEARKVAELKPDYVAVEPPELIGGPVSVTTNPELIKKSVFAVKGKSRLLVGAGVKTRADCKAAKKLGAKGVLVASGVVKAKDPKKAIEELTI